MKKRLFTLALVLGVLLSMCASAWATDDASYKWVVVDGGPLAEYTHVVVNSERIDKTFNIRAVIVLSSKDHTVTGYSTGFISADKLVLSTYADTGAPVKNLNINSLDNVSSDNTIVSIDLMSKSFNSGQENVFGYLNGDVANDTGSGNVHIVFSLKSGDHEYYSKDISINFSNSGTDQKTAISSGGSLFPNISSTTVMSDDSLADITDSDSATTITSRDYGDAYNDDLWDGLDPKFSAEGTASEKLKVKITGSNPKKPSFTAGEVGDFTVTITGSRPKDIDVYIAAKDAAKLFGIAKADAKDISLTRANIKDSLAKGYSIPFRVTSHDISSEDSKNATSTITIAFNGAKVSFKGYPITVSATNANMSGKTAKKTFKIDVSPSTTVPIWKVDDTLTTVPSESTDLLASLDTDYVLRVQTYDYSVYSKDLEGAADDIDESSTAGSYRITGLGITQKEILVVSMDDDGNLIVASGDSGTLSKVNPRSEDLINIVDAAQFTSEDETVYYFGSLHDSYVTAVPVLTSKDWNLCVVPVSADFYVYYKSYGYQGLSALDAKEIKKQEVIVSTQEADGKVDEAIFYAGLTSGDYGPYTISAKPTKADVKTKFSKTLKDGNVFDIVQPVLNGLGEISKDGYVVIGGDGTKLAELKKETKSAITFTSTKATKKKAALKVTVKGTVAPYFDVDGKKVVKKGDELYLGPVKRVETGKVPSVKFKAKGSKTIYYYTEAAKELEEVGLSLDAKKGAIFALSKGKTYPTVNASNDLQSLDICVLAQNDAGDAKIRAEFAITGAKPKFDGKTAAFTAGVVNYQSIKMKAGKNDPTSRDKIVFSAATTDDSKKLSEYGLSIVAWDKIQYTVTSKEIIKSGDETVSADPTYFVSGDVISKDGKLGSHDVNFKVLAPGSYKTVTSADAGITSDDSADIAQGTGNIAVYWGKLSGDEFVWDTKLQSKDYYSNDVLQSKDVELVVVSKDESLQNYLILQSSKSTKVPSDKKPVTIAFKASNIGSAEATGKIKITISAKTGSSRNFAGADDSASALFGRNGRNGTAGKTGNGLAGGNGEYGEGSEYGEDEAAEEAVVTIGAPRTLANLTAAQKAFLAENGYKVIAVLPEISANVEGQQDFDVELDEDAPEGEKMVYIPFPKDVEETEDDLIVDFYDETGSPIEEVPAEKDIVAAPWLRADVVYQPVIAVKDAE